MRRIVVLATHPSPPEIQAISLVFGRRKIRGLPRNPGKTGSPKAQRRYQATMELINADLVDKVSQVVNRLRGFRNRPDCKVVVYLWDRVEAIYKVGGYPFLWDPPADTGGLSIVGALYNKGKDLRPNQVDDIVARIRAAKMRKRFIGATTRIRGDSVLERNLKVVATRLWQRWHPLTYQLSLKRRGKLKKITKVLGGITQGAG